MISHIRLAAFAALLTLTSNAAAQAQTPTLEDGQQAFQRHDYGMAAQIWFPLAQQGNAEAQAKVKALAEQQAKAEEKARLKAEAHAKAEEEARAAKQAKAEAVAKAKAEAAAKKAEEARLAEADAATRLQAGLDAYQKEDYATALKALTPLAKAGDAAAQLHLGMMNELGRGVPKSDKKATAQYRLASSALFR